MPEKRRIPGAGPRIEGSITVSVKRVLFLAQHFITLYSYRRELIETLIRKGNEVYLSLPAAEENAYFADMGCRIIPTDIERRGANPLKDLQLLAFYRKMIPEVDPDIIFSYTIKPNVYGALAVNGRKRKNGKPFRQVCNITGTGGMFLEDHLINRICRFLYRHSVKNSYKVFFQNTNDRDMFIRNRMTGDNWEMIPGSGVNLEQFHFCPMPEGTDVNFIFIGRLMKLKGIDEYLEAAGNVKGQYPNTHFYVAGFIEEGEYKEKMESYRDTVVYLGFQKDISSWIQRCHCTVLPSHGGEGVPNVVLESSAMGRICIGSRIPGTQDAIDEGRTGFLFEPGKTEDLAEAIRKVVLMAPAEKAEMGLAGRRKVEKEFDRRVVIQRYMEEVEKA